jgi:hypothetical protein
MTHNEGAPFDDALCAPLSVVEGRTNKNYREEPQP